MTIYKQHVFVCNNRKENNDQCCGVHNSAEIIAYAKQRAKELGLSKLNGFRLSSSGCMGRCSEGPVLVVYPAGIWYTYQSKEDINNLLESLANGSYPLTNRLENSY